MRSTLLLSPLLLLAFFSGACGDDNDRIAPSENGPSAGTGGGAGEHSTENGGTGSEQPVQGEPGGSFGDIGEAVQLSPGSASLVGVTSDGWALFRDGEALNAVELAEGGAVELVSEHPGSVIIEGPVAFNFADVDWTKNIGDLTIWDRRGGAHEVGPTLFSEALVAASNEGDAVVYTENAGKTTADLVVRWDGESQVLIEDMGLASETTCGANLGFVGSRLFVGWCEKDERDGRIDRFELGDDGWERERIADETLASWSADSSGDRVFFQSNGYEGYYAEGGEKYRIDASVSRGFVLPDGSAVLYTVGDQLRRASLPDPEPVPVVTVGYSAPVAFTRDFTYALYSSKVTYENGTQRDLRLVPTDGFTPEPIELVAEPVATLPRSSMTSDGQFVLYLTDVGPEGGTLHVVGLDGQERIAVPNVLEAVAARESSLVFTANPSDPEVYPVVSDLMWLDAASGEPVLIEEKIVDGRNFRLDGDLAQVVYSRSGVDRDLADPASQGLFVRALP